MRRPLVVLLFVWALQSCVLAQGLTAERCAEVYTKDDYEGCARQGFRHPDAPTRRTAQPQATSGAAVPLALEGTLLDPNDDGTAPVIDVGGHPLHLFDTAQSQLFINNNGLISFTEAVSAFTPVLPEDAGFPSIAPYWGDVDTRCPRTSNCTHLNKVWYRLDDPGDLSAAAAALGTAMDHALVATWNDVGFYQKSITLRNTFQALLAWTNASTVICFFYEKLEWTTGSASGGSGGLGGEPAIAGMTDGIGQSYTLPGSGTGDVLNLVHQRGGNLARPGWNGAGQFCYSVFSSVPTGPWAVAVQLSNDKQSVLTDIGEAAFNAAFEACPVVRYRRTGDVYALYARTSPVPAGFNAYRLFTDTWASADNRLNVDFELYSSEADLAQGQRQWQYCSYGDADVGFPGECGPSGSIANRWFSMPGGRYTARNANGAGFDVYNGTGCPARIQQVQDHVVATVYEGPGCTLRSRALNVSDFPPGRHADGWDACYGTWDDGSAIAHTRLRSFRVHPGYAVNTSSPCHDDFYYPGKTNRLTRVTVADGCLDVDYDFNYLEYNSSTPAVDCTWGDYGGWSNCSVTCGGGQQSRTRAKTTVEANGGRCPGGSVEVRSCNTHDCGVCRYTVTSAGDAYQGPWSTATFDGPCGLTFSWTHHGLGVTGLPPLLRGPAEACAAAEQTGVIGLYGADGMAYVKGSCSDQSIRVIRVESVRLADQDCQGHYSACTRACETAAQRTFTQTVPQQANGAACPAATDCGFRDGQCIGPGGGDGTNGVYLFGGAIGNDVWKLVRRQQPSGTWHTATDNLAGTDVYGVYNPSDSAAASFSIKFDASSGLRCDQFLFMSGDRAKWLVASNASVAGAPYGTAPRPVARSSVDRFPHAVEWEHRAGAAEGPWISLTDHAVAVSQGDVIYAEAAWPGVGVGGTKLLQEHNGANVFCRVMEGTCHNDKKDGAETGRDCGGECEACVSAGCSKLLNKGKALACTSSGDPHVITFAGPNSHPMGQGEFVLATCAGTFAVHACHQPASWTIGVSITTAFAIKSAAGTFKIIDGALPPFPPESGVTVGGTKGNKITFPTGEVVIVGRSSVRNAGRLTVKLPATCCGNVAGLCGAFNPDADFKDRFTNSTGGVGLYPKNRWRGPYGGAYQRDFAESWKLLPSDAAAVFTPSECPAATAPPVYPVDPPLPFSGCPDGLEAQALAQCPPGRLYDNCVTDVGATCDLSTWTADAIEAADDFAEVDDGDIEVPEAAEGCDVLKGKDPVAPWTTLEERAQVLSDDDCQALCDDLPRCKAWARRISDSHCRLGSTVPTDFREDPDFNAGYSCADPVCDAASTEVEDMGRSTIRCDKQVIHQVIRAYQCAPRSDCGTQYSCALPVPPEVSQMVRAACEGSDSGVPPPSGK